MTSDLLEENQDLRKQVLDLEQKVEIERNSRIALVNKIAELEKSCDETQELLDKQIEATYKLDKENAELKEQVNKWLNAYSDTSLVKVLRDCIYKNEKMKHTPEEIKYRLSDLGVQIGNIAIEYITELEKENAELKDDNKVMADNYSKMEQKFYDNLTTAKELLKWWVNHCGDHDLFYAEKTERFLREVEK